jgi:hypothetical protein
MSQPDPQQAPVVAAVPLARPAASAPGVAMAAAAPRNFNLFLPHLLLALAVVGWLAFQTWQQFSDHRQLAAAGAALEPQEQAATKLRASLESLATATARLAANGNANAKAVVDDLRKRGVTINANGPAKQP